VLQWMLIGVLFAYRGAEMIVFDDGPFEVFVWLRSLPSSMLMYDRKPARLWNTLQDLLGCPYCVGVWMSMFAAAVIVAGLRLGVMQWVLLSGSIAGGQSLLETVVRGDHDA